MLLKVAALAPLCYKHGNRQSLRARRALDRGRTIKSLNQTCLNEAIFVSGCDRPRLVS